MFRKALYFTLCIAAAILLITQNAQATCNFQIESFSIDMNNYDPLSKSDKRGTITYSIRNTGDITCSFKAYFCSKATTQKNGTSDLSFRITPSGGHTSLLNQTALTECPSSSTGLQLAEQKTVADGALYTSSLDFDMMIPNGQFVARGNYLRDIGLAVFTSYGTKKDSRQTAASTTVLPSCEMTSQATSYNSNNATYSPTGSVAGGTVDFSSAIDSQRATLKDSSVQLTFSGSRCNYNAHVSIQSKSGGMLKTSGSSAASGGFLNRIDYTALLSFCNTQVQLSTQTDGSTAQVTQCTLDGLNLSDLLLTISTTAGNTPLLAGHYEDILTVQIGTSL